jgi:UDP-N-acetylglucosamine 4-epimerase
MTQFVSGLNIENKWLITGVAGFIGSNLLQFLLESNQEVIGVDNFITGKNLNLEEVQRSVNKEQWKKFKFIKGDIRDYEICRLVCEGGVDCILHQAALGSVPRSILDPIATNENNVSGFLNILVAAQKAGVRKVVYASSSSVYGDNFSLPKVESTIGTPLSPYAITKLANEIYASNFTVLHGMQTVGLRYFNVFGRRQDPYGQYSAVIPRWIDALINGKQVIINGDGSTTRDFCYIENVIQANILAGLSKSMNISGQVFNIACGESISLKELYSVLVNDLKKHGVSIASEPIYGEFREGDIRVSLASIQKARDLLNYNPKVDVRSGILATIKYCIDSKNNV